MSTIRTLEQHILPKLTYLNILSKVITSKYNKVIDLDCLPIFTVFFFFKQMPFHFINQFSSIRFVDPSLFILWHSLTFWVWNYEIHSLITFVHFSLTSIMTYANNIIQEWRMKMGSKIIPIFRVRMVLTTDVHPIYTMIERSYLGLSGKNKH